MSADAGDSNRGPGQEPGRPIHALRDLEYEASPEFLIRVRGRIHRRITASQITSYSWHLPRMVALELARLLGHFLPGTGNKEESDK